MSEQQPRNDASRASGQLQRRGLLAAVAGVAAGLLTKVTTQPAAAADGQSMIIGALNQSNTTTQMSSTVGGSNGALLVTNSGGDAIYANAGDTGNVGLRAYSSVGYPVYATSTNYPALYASSANNQGIQASSTTNHGIYATSRDYYGVYGLSTNNTGVLGYAPNGYPGVYGQSSTGYGVYGLGTGASAVAGHSDNHPGLYGESVNAQGIYGTASSSTGGAYGVYGTSAVAGVVGYSGAGIGVYGQVSSGGYAGRFDGPVLIAGNFQATGTKSAVVPHPDGTHRLLYALECPENWFEDFGEAQLVRGRAQVPIDAEFAGTIDASHYLVFLTPHDATVTGLAVVARQPDHFTVQELGGGASNAAFAYRLVAKRRGHTTQRLEKVSVPAGPLPPATPPRTMHIPQPTIPESLPLPSTPPGGPPRPPR